MTAGAATLIQQCLDRLRAGDPAARGELLRVSRERLKMMTRKMLRGFPGVARWEQTDDVLQNALMRLERSLAEVALDRPHDFLNLAATQIRRELIDLARHYAGPLGLGANYVTPDATRPGGAEQIPDEAARDTVGLADWSQFHEQVAALPAEEREIFDLLWYNGMSQAEAAALLGVNVRTVKRRWQSARLLLAQALGNEPPPG